MKEEKKLADEANFFLWGVRGAPLAAHPPGGVGA